MRRTARPNGPIAHLEGFSGILQVDGYAGYRALAERGHVRLAFCWAHVRRRFYEIAAAGAAPIATEALARIAELYALEAEMRGRPADERRTSGLNAPSRSSMISKSGSRPSSPWSPKEHRRGGDPLRLIAVGGLWPLHRGWTGRDRFQHRRTCDPPARPKSEERASPVSMAAANIGRSSRPSARPATEQRRSRSLSLRRSRPPRRRSSRQSSRRLAALELGQLLPAQRPRNTAYVVSRLTSSFS